jgi:hypothetical protein
VEVVVVIAEMVEQHQTVVRQVTVEQVPQLIPLGVLQLVLQLQSVAVVVAD